jgi:desulfoferrodoxin-like iron-binding protein
MTGKGEVYVCKICGNVVEVIASGAGAIVYRGQHMQLEED